MRSSSRQLRRTLATCSAALALLSTSDAVAQSGYTNFESTVVHPIGVSADGLRLYATHTADDRLAVYSLADPAEPVLLREVSVGLRPGSLAVRGPDEVWVCNLLSDTISVVAPERGLVLATIPVEDEPSDVAFAGGRAFVTCATRDRVMVFDVQTHAPVGSIDVFGKEPRALAVDATGSKVYALSRRSGNGTTILDDGMAPPQPQPGDPSLPPAPQVGRIVRADDPQWQSHFSFTLPDEDVFEIDPQALTVTRAFRGVGTSNFDLCVHPVSGAVLVANSDARNLVHLVTNLRGHVVDHRVTAIHAAAPSASVLPFDLNAGIDYSVLPNPSALATALADPTGLALDASNDLLYVAAEGTDRIGVIDLSIPAVVARIEVGGTPGAAVATREKRGPRSMVLHPTSGLLYTFNRLSASISVVDTQTRTVITEVAVGAYDPEPAHVREGRKFLYDAKLSGNGTISCASCHVDGEDDGLVWDLGDPLGQMTTVPLAFQQGANANGPPPANFPALHPMKGPLVTQTLRGLGGRPHWRGDLDGFGDFNATFSALMGGSPISSADMAIFEQWSETVVFPPNPNQNIDRTLTPVQQQGFNRFSQGFISCISCHVQPTGSNGKVRDTPQGTNQPMKVAPLRNYYRRSDLSKFSNAPIKAGFGLFKDGEAGVLSDIANLGGTMGPNSAMETFLRAWDTGTAPATGVQVQLDSGSGTAASVDLQLLESRAAVGEIDLVVQGREADGAVAYRYDPVSDRYTADEAAKPPQTRAGLLQLAAAGDLVARTTAVPPGDGARAVDRDLDGLLDGDERAQSYGTASASPCAQVPAISANGQARVGNSAFALVATGAAPTPMALVLGTASGSSQVLGVEVLVALGPDAVLALLLPDARGVATWAMPIPANPSLHGFTLHAQVAQPTICGDFTASAGLAVVVGA